MEYIIFFKKKNKKNNIQRKCKNCELKRKRKEKKIKISKKLIRQYCLT